jgi:hypothetical protein
LKGFFILDPLCPWSLPVVFAGHILWQKKDYLPYLVDNEIQVGVCTPCAINRSLYEVKVFNF